MELKRPKTDVGIIVARFQVAELTPPQLGLIQGAVDNHPKVIVFLGVSPLKTTPNNPLDFESRKQMVLEAFPDVNVLYIDDVGNDEKWSKQLDKQIKSLVGPNTTCCLYGGHKSFIEHYTTKTHQTCELEQIKFVSGTDERLRISKVVKASKEWRQGVIWAANNQYSGAKPTIDVAIWNLDFTKLLMARKENEDKYRFIGGFVDGKESKEACVRREVMEEAHIEISDPLYIASCPIDDWRYRGEKNGIVTTFYEAIHLDLTPKPDDDIVELKWFDAKKIKEKDIVVTHHPLLNALIEKCPERMSWMR